MGEYRSIVETFADDLRNRISVFGPISGLEIPILISGSGSMINCYPGVLGYGCFDMAFIVSLTAKSLVHRKWHHLNFEGALDAVYRHLFEGEAPCANITRAVIILVDSWNARVWELWKDKIDNIKRVANLEIYLMVDFNINEIKV
jgi:hypothetical protein